jgi:hypothetical protein
MLYKKIDPASESTVTTALDLFRTPPTAAAISKLLSKTSELLLMGEKVIIIFIILLIHLFNYLVFNSNQLYSYKVYLDTELSYPKDIKNTFLGLVGYATDGSDQDAVSNVGFKNRQKYFSKNNAAQFITNIDSDLFCQDLYLINNCEIDIEVTPQNDDFMLLKDAANADKYRLELVNIKLYVKMIELMDGLSLDLAKRLDFNPARYSMRKTMLKSLFISEGRYEFNSNIFTDEVHRRVILGLLENEAFHGHLNKSPFNFKNFDVQDI